MRSRVSQKKFVFTYCLCLLDVLYSIKIRIKVDDPCALDSKNVEHGSQNIFFLESAIFMQS